MLIVCRGQENSSTTKEKQYLLSERLQSTNLYGVETSRFYSMPKLENYNLNRLILLNKDLQVK